MKCALYHALTYIDIISIPPKHLRLRLSPVLDFLIKQVAIFLVHLVWWIEEGKTEVRSEDERKRYFCGMVVWWNRKVR